jgi:hypothetical protein
MPNRFKNVDSMRIINQKLEEEAKTKAQRGRSMCVGRHTDYICTQLRAISAGEFNELMQERVSE